MAWRVFQEIPLFRGVFQNNWLPVQFLRGALACSLAFLWAGGDSAHAFTSANANTLVTAYNTKFYVQDTSTRGHFKNTETTGATYFWGQAEEIEGIIDAYERTGTASYLTQAGHLLNGFANTNGTDWGYNIYNDDIMWACIAHLRVYLHGGSSTFRDRAKTNFDLAYTRGWDAAGGGGFWWTTAKTSKVTAVNCPATIVAYLLYLAYGDSSYLTKSQTMFAWSKANLWNSATGQVYDAPGSLTPTTYNQGTFAGAADYHGDNASALLVSAYTMNNMGSATWNGHCLMPMYDIDGNNSGFNGIGLRWICKFLFAHNLEGDFIGWLQTNANAAWNIRRTTDNLSWCEWHNPTPTSEVFHSWDCISSVVALQVIPTDTLPVAPTNLAAAFTDGTIVLNWGKQASYGKTYTLKRSTAYAGPYTTIASNLAAVTYTDAAVLPDTVYYYTVSATNDAGTGPDSSPLVFTYATAGKLTGTVIGTNGAFGGGSTNTKDKVYDGLLNTYFDSPNASGDWAGLDFGSGNAKVITRIRYSPRNSSTANTSNAARMVGGKLQGANINDFSDAVTLFTVPGIPPYNVYSTTTINNATPFRYVRYLSPNSGQCNVSEVEFYSDLPTPPAGLRALTGTGTAALTWNAAAVATGYNVKRATSPIGPYTTVASNVVTTTYDDSGLTVGATYYYVVSAITDLGETGDSDRLAINPPAGTKLIGTIFNNGTVFSPNTPDRAFDGLLNTYFEVNNDTGWVRLSLSTDTIITGLRFSPRNSNTSSQTNANFMIGGRFEASNDPNFSNAVILFTVPSAPAYSTLTCASVPVSSTTYRYVRYITAAGHNCNVSEIEFYGVSLPAAPSGLAAQGASGTATLTWNAISGATYQVKRSETSGGPYAVIASNVATPSFEDTGLIPNGVYYYVVSATNEAGEGPNSFEVTTADGYTQWIIGNGYVPGAGDTGFLEDADGNGISNAMEYMNPTGLTVTPGVSTSTITALVRVDDAITITLLASTNLTAWTEISFPETADQSGVPAGFVRLQAEVAVSPSEPNKFYRLQLTR